MRYAANIISRFLRGDDAASAVEYAVLLALIIVTAIGAVLSTGDVQQNLWQDNSEIIDEAIQP